MGVQTLQIDRLDTRTRWIIAVMAVAALLAVLNGTTVTASLESLAPELGTSISGVVWVTTAYLIAASASVPLIGWLTERVGPDRVLQLALFGFAIGSLLCGLARDLTSMVVFRVVQGLAGGMLEPAAMAVIGLVTPAARMGRVMGFVSIPINGGPLIGPLVGLVLVNAGAWPWIFWLNTPLAILIGLIALGLLPRAASQLDGRRTSIDVVGILLLPPGFVLVLLGFNRWGAGAAPGLVAGFLILGVVLLIAYVWHAPRVAEPLLDIRLLRIPSFAAALGVMSGVGLIMYTQLAVLPMLAQRNLGLEGVWQAAPVVALGAGLMISMVLAGRLSDTFGPRWIVFGGAVITAAFAAVITFGASDLPLAVVLAAVFIIGLGFGATASPTFASVYRVLPKESVGQGTAALFIVVQLFASVGVTLVGFLTTSSGDPAQVAYGLVAIVAVAIVGASHLLPARRAGVDA